MSLTRPQIIQAAGVLAEARTSGTPIGQLPGNLVPLSKAEGFAIGAEIEKTSSSPLYGWKIAATSAAGQRHLEVDQPIAGRLLAEWVIPDGGTLQLGERVMSLAEVEFAFTMAAELAPREAAYTHVEVLAAVASLHPAIELPDTRFTQFTRVGIEQLVADQACASEFVLGPAAPDGWQDNVLAAAEVAVTVLQAGTVAAELEGRGSNVLAGPLDALTWLVNELTTHGITLRAGQVVTTGTVVTPIELAPGMDVIAHFGELGIVSLHCA